MIAIKNGRISVRLSITESSQIMFVLIRYMGMPYTMQWMRLRTILKTKSTEYARPQEGNVW